MSGRGQRFQHGGMSDYGEFSLSLANAVYQILFELSQSLHEVFVTLIVLVLLQLGDAVL